MGFRHVPWAAPQLNGKKKLIYGNHDGGLFKNKQVGDYLMFFDTVELTSQITLSIEGKDVVFNMSHLPYRGGGDSGYEERFTSKRLEDDGTPLLHGHCHSTPDQRHRISKKGTWCFDVGVDGNNFYPYSEEEICKLYLATL
jgi:calcineurin-like phosphoesterase family protein